MVPDRDRDRFFRHFSLFATVWFVWFWGSALEPTELQALPAETGDDPDPCLEGNEAEPRKQCVPKQEPGNELFLQFVVILVTLSV